MEKKKYLLFAVLILSCFFGIAATPNAWTLDNFWTLIDSDLYYDEGDIHVGEDLWLDGDLFKIEGKIVNGSWMPLLNNTFAIGNSTNLWKEGWFSEIYGAGDFVVTSDGNVGIGTTSPTYALDVVGDIGVDKRLVHNGDDNTAIDFYEVDKIALKAGGWNMMKLIEAGVASEIIVNPDGQVLDFRVKWDSGEGLFVDGADGNVGIGNTTPNDKLVVNGNITSENVFIPQYEFAHTNHTINLDTVNVWKNISFEQEDSDVSYGIKHTYNDETNHTFMIMDDGVYEINYDFDMEDTSIGASNTDVAGRLIYSNGTEVIGSDFETDITKQSAETELSHDFLAIFQAGDIVVCQFVGDDVDVQISTHGTFGDHPESASVVMKKIANL